MTANHWTFRATGVTKRFGEVAANDGVGIASLVADVIAGGAKVAAVNNGIGPDLNSLEPQVEGLTTTAGSVGWRMGPPAARL